MVGRGLQGGSRRTGAVAIGLVVAALVTPVLSEAPGRARTPRPTQPQPPVCFECFWEHQDPALRHDLLRYYESYRPEDPLVEAERRLVLARLRGVAASAEETFRGFASLLPRERDPLRRLLVVETLAFAAGGAGRKPARYFAKAAKAADQCGQTSKARIYRSLAEGRFEPRFGSTLIWRRPRVPLDTEAYVLGASAVHVRPGWRVGVQADRTVRDWLSNQLWFAFPRRPLGRDDLLAWHEGARVRDLLGFVDVVTVPLMGALAARQGGRWLAADEAGTFRFEVLDDKVQYPTTRVSGELALLMDTHGISALVAPAMDAKVDLVVGCADTAGKVEAAYHLAQRGVHVYFPCDRFVGDLVGHDAGGTLIGSAPIRPEPGGAVIGDRPIRFRLDETVVVEDANLPGELQYYDGPARYFARLREFVPARIERVRVEGGGQSDRVVRRAEEVGAAAIAVRVWTEEDYRPVRQWLAASAVRRAVLFHSAPYTPGYRLFEEFPRQTTFGDTRPLFLGPQGAASSPTGS